MSPEARTRVSWCQTRVDTTPTTRHRCL